MGSSFDYAVRRKDKLKEPGDYRVVLLNDDYTTMDFVVMILVNIFHKTEEAAEHIMLSVHEKGRGEAGIYSHDIALTKAAQVYSLAAKNKFPLKCIVERV